MRTKANSASRLFVIVLPSHLAWPHRRGNANPTDASRRFGLSLRVGTVQTASAHRWAGTVSATVNPPDLFAVKLYVESTVAAVAAVAQSGHRHFTVTHWASLPRSRASATSSRLSPVIASEVTCAPDTVRPRQPSALLTT